MSKASPKAAGHGSEHWWRQRVSSVALCVLSLALIYGIISTIGQDYATASARLADPGVAALVILFIIFAFYHAALGMQVVFEDYVDGAARTVCIVVMQLLFVFLGVTGVVSVISLLS